MNSFYKWVVIGAALALNGCSLVEVDPEPQVDKGFVTRINGPEDIIPFEAIGGGKLAFGRGLDYFIIDSDAKTSWGLQGTYRAALSPDGKYIAYESPQIDHIRSEIFVYDIERTQFTKMLETQYTFYNPCWTADSKYVLYEVVGPARALLRQSLNETTTSTVMTYEYHDHITSNISASALDNLIFSFTDYIVSSGESVSGIFTVRPDGTQLKQLTTDSTTKALAPAWSPNGDFIAFMNTTTTVDPVYPGLFHYTQFQVTLLDKDGKNASIIATFQAVGNHLTHVGAIPAIAWSPDGTKLAFNMFEADGAHIYVINADGSGLTKITSKLEAQDGQLSWLR